MRMIANCPSTLRSLSDIDRSIAANDGHIYGDGVIAWRMAKKPFQQGRSERKPEEVHTALRVGRSPLQWVLANGKAPQ